MKIRHNAAIALSGISWMGIGVLLLVKGFSYILIPSENILFLSFLKSLAGNFQQASLLLVGLGLFIGFLKGRMVLSKSAGRIIRHITALPNPSSITSIYPKSYLILLGSMMTLGMLLKWIPMACDLKGLIDIAVGSALINGSAFYFRHFTKPSKGICK